VHDIVENTSKQILLLDSKIEQLKNNNVRKMNSFLDFIGAIRIHLQLRD